MLPPEARDMHIGLAAIFQNPGKQRTDHEVYQNDLRLASLAERVMPRLQALPPVEDRRRIERSA
jgi:hypothetical protein